MCGFCDPGTSLKTLIQTNTHVYTPLCSSTRKLLLSKTGLLGALAREAREPATQNGATRMIQACRHKQTEDQRGGDRARESCRHGHFGGWGLHQREASRPGRLSVWLLKRSTRMCHGMGCRGCLYVCKRMLACVLRELGCLSYARVLL